MGPIIKKASIDDLEWSLTAIDYQLEETPHWIKDEKRLGELQAWVRRIRAMAAEVLHNKRVGARLWAWLFRTAGGVSLVIFGTILGWALSKYFG
jgi:hypothetical protein